jgi:hypothetical protein
LSDFLISLWTENELARSLITSLGLLIVYFLSVTWLRRKAGQTHPRFRTEDVRFKESKVSGFSDRTLAAKRGGARNSLVVTVLHDAVLIEPDTIIKRLIPPGMNEMEHYIKKSDILQVEPDTLFSHKTVRIKFNAHDRSVRVVTLMLKDQEGFVRAAKPQAQSGGAGPSP